MAQCKEGEWKSSNYLQDTSTRCEYCNTAIQQIKDSIIKLKTPDEISQIVKDACAKIGDPNKELECKAFADIYIDAVIQLIKADVDGKIVCGLLKFCNNHGDLGRAALPLARSLDGSTPSNSQDSQSSGNPICDECRTFFRIMQATLLANEAETVMEQMFLSQLCARLGPVELECQSLVRSQMPALLRSYSDGMVPDVICSKIGCCSPSENIGFPNTVSRCLSPDGLSIQYSHLCSAVVHQFENKDEIEAFIRLKICANLGTSQSTCETFVHLLNHQFMESLVRAVNLGPRCRQLVNEGSQSGNSLLFPNVPQPMAARAVGDPASATHVDRCGVCLMITGKLKSYLHFSALELNLQTMASEVCDSMPSELTAACSVFMQTMNPGNIIIRLKDREDPVTICKDLNACTRR
jgi:hypothetical protein